VVIDAYRPPWCSTASDGRRIGFWIGFWIGLSGRIPKAQQIGRPVPVRQAQDPLCRGLVADDEWQLPIPRSATANASAHVA